MIFDIIEYLGKYENGVLLLLSINYNSDYYDSTFFYTDEFITLTVDELLEEKIGVIEEWDGYNQLIIDIMNRVIPYNEIIGRLDELTFED